LGGRRNVKVFYNEEATPPTGGERSKRAGKDYLKKEKHPVVPPRANRKWRQRRAITDGSVSAKTEADSPVSKGDDGNDGTLKKHRGKNSHK